MAFYRTRVSIDVLSEDSIEGLDIDSILHQINEGEMLGGNIAFKAEALTPKEMAKATKKLGGDPSFFELTDNGLPIKDE